MDDEDRVVHDDAGEDDEAEHRDDVEDLAGVTRLRPVILTAITTILGLIPLTTGVSFDFRTLSLEIGGESSQWWGPMGVAVSFGLAFATVLTLIVVPVLYACFFGIPRPEVLS